MTPLVIGSGILLMIVITVWIAGSMGSLPEAMYVEFSRTDNMENKFIAIEDFKAYTSSGAYINTELVENSAPINSKSDLTGTSVTVNGFNIGHAKVGTGATDETVKVVALLQNSDTKEKKLRFKFRTPYKISRITIQVPSSDDAQLNFHRVGIQLLRFDTIPIPGSFCIIPFSGIRKYLHTLTFK